MPAADLLAPAAPAKLALLLTLADAAKALALSERTVWQLAEDGEIPRVRVGRAVRFAVDDLRAWIERKRGAAK